MLSNYSLQRAFKNKISHSLSLSSNSHCILLFDQQPQIIIFSQMGKIQKVHMILNALSAFYPKTSNVLKIIGLLLVIKKVVRILTFFYKTFLRPRKNFKEAYGQGSWAFVTGSSDGIGKAIAGELAKQGFNIVLSARTSAKLQMAKNELKARYPAVEVKTLVVDFAKSGRATYLAEVVAQLRDLDISILVNNVGVDVLDYYHNLSEQQIINLITINCIAGSLLTRLFIPLFLQRYQDKYKRCAIINVASLAGQIPLALHNTYSASKAYVDFLSRSLSYEYQDSIDIISLRPSEVSTPMTFNKQVDLMTILPEDCARGLINDLGYERVTNGHWSHGLQAALYHFVPQWVFNRVFLKVLGPQFMKDREAARRRLE